MECGLCILLSGALDTPTSTYIAHLDLVCSQHCLLCVMHTTVRCVQHSGSSGMLYTLEMVCV